MEGLKKKKPVSKRKLAGKIREEWAKVGATQSKPVYLCRPCGYEDSWPTEHTSKKELYEHLVHEHSLEELRWEFGP